jgi:ABC-type antimicrobial peptide transport system permease subunit
MRKVILLITALFFSICAIGQAPKSKVVSINVPAGAVQLTKEQAAEVIHANFKQTSIPLDKENYYQLNGLVMSFWDDEVNPEFNRSLEDIRSGILGVFHYNHDVVNFAKIILVNNVHFLIYEFQKDDGVVLRFQSEFTKSNKGVLGIIEFKKPDEEKAQKALQDLLQSIHFKE